MSYCVLMHRADSIYDDRPDIQYQFPKQYLSRAQTSIGDWIVYLEPTKVRGTRGYFAVARIGDIIADPNVPEMYIALIDPGSYLDFARPVPFGDGSLPFERGLLNASGRLSGRAQAAVRPIAAQDFQRIVNLGLDDEAAILPRTDQPAATDGFEETQSPYLFDEPRDRIERLTSRILRDRVFRKIVLRAYDERCAITGLKLINGGGRAEVNAAHIQPVEANGPDIVTNGIALSGTAHWMFDRGLIGLSDDFEILVSSRVNDVASVESILNRSRRAIVPARIAERPHARFLGWHRANCFKP